MNMYLLGVKNILDKNPELAHDEVRLGATFLKSFGYQDGLDIAAVTKQYNTLEELFHGEHIDGYNIESIRNIMNEYL